MNYLLNNINSFVMGGYAGNHKMGISDTDVAVGAASGITTAAATLQFNKSAVAPATITMGAAVKGSTSVSFPEWSKVATSSVDNNSAGAEGADTALVDLTSVANTVEVLRNTIAVQVTDLVAHGTSEAYLVQAGQVLGNAVAAEFDTNVLAAFDNFATSKGSDDSLRFLDIMDALASLEANDAPRPYSAVLHPQQMYGSFGLSNEFGISAVSSSNGAFNGGHAVSVGEQFMGAGFVTNIAGINFFTSPQVMDGATGRKKGAVYAKTALAAGFIDFGGGNFIEIKTDRNELGASTQLVANGYWAVTELVDLHGVEIHTEIS
tara:strand:- start:1960 stop:2919 length:960 start_codon:yes stop_codon:yes gene_type:complete